jgi:hypothetical protein
MMLRCLQNLGFLNKSFSIVYAVLLSFFKAFLRVEITLPLFIYI